MIPVHWATFNLAMHSWIEPAKRLLVAAERTGIEVAIPRPGQSIEPASPPAPERWWPEEVAWETAEEHPIVSSGTSRTVRRKPLLRELNERTATV